MSVFIDSLLNGLTLGAYYALVTLGLALIFGVARLVNFAHGDFFMVGGYILFLLQSFPPVPIPYLVIVVITTLVMVLFGVLFERLVVHDIIDRSWNVHLVATLASSIILSNAALLIFRSDPKQVPTLYSTTTIAIFGAQTSVQRLIVLGTVIVVFLWLQWFLARTWTGKVMRAVSQNRDTSVVVGIDIRRIIVITFGLSAGLAGLAAALLAPLYNVSPSMGSLITLKALAAVVMGGLGQINGAFFAAFIIGIVESFFAAYIPGGFAYKDVASFAILISVLMFKPYGLFGRKIGL
jgi:branched-chain amino acid transport system permease protein